MKQSSFTDEQIIGLLKKTVANKPLQHQHHLAYLYSSPR
jgi:hypothetical protein